MCLPGSCSAQGGRDHARGSIVDSSIPEHFCWCFFFIELLVGKFFDRCILMGNVFRKQESGRNNVKCMCDVASLPLQAHKFIGWLDPHTVNAGQIGLDAHIVVLLVFIQLLNTGPGRNIGWMAICQL